MPWTWQLRQSLKGIPNCKYQTGSLNQNIFSLYCLVLIMINTTLALLQKCLHSLIFQIIIEHPLCVRYSEKFQKINIEQVLIGTTSVRKETWIQRDHIIGEQTYGEGSQKRSLRNPLWPQDFIWGEPEEEWEQKEQHI